MAGGADSRTARALRSAVLNNDRDGFAAALAEAVKAGAVNEGDKQGHTALHWAAGQQRPGMVDALIGAGADIGARTNDGQSVLQAAVRSYQGEKSGPNRSVARLLAAGDNPVNDYGRVAVLAAIGLGIGLGDDDAVRLLLDACRRAELPLDEHLPGWMEEAARRHDTPCVQQLLIAGADATAETGDEQARQSLLHVAVRGVTEIPNATGVLRVLVSAGADVNARDYRGMTALMCAAGRDQVPETKALIHLGADGTLLDENGWAAIHFAAHFSHGEVLSWLGQKQPETVNLPTREGRRTPLHFLAGSCSDAALQVANALRCDIHARDVTGNTPLHIALASQNIRASRYLRHAGAREDVKNEDGRTPEQALAALAGGRAAARAAAAPAEEAAP